MRGRRWSAAQHTSRSDCGRNCKLNDKPCTQSNDEREQNLLCSLAGLLHLRPHQSSAECSRHWPEALRRYSSAWRLGKRELGIWLAFTAWSQLWNPSSIFSCMISFCLICLFLIAAAGFFSTLHAAGFFLSKRAAGFFLAKTVRFAAGLFWTQEPAGPFLPQEAAGLFLTPEADCFLPLAIAETVTRKPI